MIPFSVLDLAPILEGGSAGNAFRNALALEPGATVRAIADFDAPHGGGELKVVMNAYPGQPPAPRRTRVSDPAAPRPRAIAP